jgi:adenylosuccinate synthase
VIGASFGDEGKDLITHYLASRYAQDVLVVRFNGGAQAGHTVITNRNQRHVFRHPFVTGLKNILKLINAREDTKLNIIYMARSYLTRHRAGPLPYELAALPYKQVVDKTNITNTHQGALRYAWFN